MLLVGRITGRFHGTGAPRPGAGFTADGASGAVDGFAAAGAIAGVTTLPFDGVTFNTVAGFAAGAGLVADDADTTGALTGGGGAGTVAFAAGGAGAGVTTTGAGVTVTAGVFFFEEAGAVIEAAGVTADDCFVAVVLEAAWRVGTAGATTDPSSRLALLCDAGNMGRMPSAGLGGGAGLDFDTRINASTSSSSSASSTSDVPPAAAADDDAPLTAAFPVASFFLLFFAPDFFDFDAYNIISIGGMQKLTRKVQVLPQNQSLYQQHRYISSAS